MHFLLALSRGVIFIAKMKVMMAALGFKIVDGVAMLYLDEDGNAYKPKKGELMDGN